MKHRLSSTQSFRVGRRLGFALPLSAVLTAALLVIPANPAAANQLGNQVTVPNTDVVSAGVGQMRGLGEGSITVSGVSGTVTQALLYWHGPTNSEVPTANAPVTFAGSPITGTNIGFSHDNCWSFDNSQAYRADVTSLVTGNGTYALAGFRKTVEETVVADVNGASLIVFFDDGDASNNHDVTLIDGNDSNFTNTFDPDGWDATISNVLYSSGPATLELHVADGQSYADDDLSLNESTLAAGPAIFQGDSVPSAGGPDPNPSGVTGNLWDIKPFVITSFMSPGSNDLHLTTGSDQDCLSLVVAAVIVQPSADLSITKADGNPDPCPGGEDPIPCGPDPVSSGKPVAYGISVTNNGPDPATGIRVTDTPQTTGATAQSGFGTNWVCTVAENVVTCTYGPTLGAEQTAEPLTVVVRAPTTTTGTTMTDEAIVSADQADPNSENNMDTENTTVTGSDDPGAKDHAEGFFDNINTLTIATTRDDTGRFYSSLTIHPDPGLEPGVVTIDEFPSSQPPYAGLCGGMSCDGQVQVSGLPVGEAAANNAMEIHWFYLKDTKQGSTIWVKGDDESVGTILKNCKRGIADPPKCVNSKTILKNGDRDIMLLWRNGGDPWGGKR